MGDENSFMKRLYFMLVLLVLTGLIAGCGSPGSEYEGKWVASVKSMFDSTILAEKMEIKKNEQNYIINFSTEHYSNIGKGKAAWTKFEKMGPKTISATLKDGRLVAGPLASYTFVKNDGTILGPNGEVYKKESPEELNRVKKEATEVYKKRYPQITIEE